MIQTDATTPGQSEPGNNGNKRVTPYFPELQNWSFTTRCSLMPYPRHMGYNEKKIYRKYVHTPNLDNDIIINTSTEKRK